MRKTLNYVALLLAGFVLACSGSDGGGASDATTDTLADAMIDTMGHDNGSCVPDCSNAWCGQGDGCGGICTRCPEYSNCNTFTWVCDCPGPWCGSTCCLVGQTCGAGGACEGQGCLPECGGKWCGDDDGCGGKCTACPDNSTCNPSTLYCDCPGSWCGGNCCMPGQECKADGTCGPCATDCAGKECGDDGCGGSCGSCDPGVPCVSGKCQPPVDGHVGEPCQSDGQCKDSGASCYPEVSGNDPTGFINGYCLVFGCSEGSCPTGSGCYPLLQDGGSLCMAKCSTVADCPQQAGYGCLKLTGLDDTICWPYCKADGDCPSASFCDLANEYCVPEEFGCSAANPTGWCPGDLVCQGGECKPWDFTCTDQTLEPNDQMNGAAPVTEQVTSGMQICQGDEDWFSLTIPKGNVGTLGMYFQHKLGDLDLCAFEADGTFLGCRYEFEDYSANWRGYDWNDEYLSALALSSDRTVYFKGDGWNNAVNEYQLTVGLKSFKDGNRCQDFYDSSECAGCDPVTGSCKTGLGKVNLIQFPFPDAGDGFVGDGYMLEHSSSYRWLRRELIMAIRNTIHEVQLKFPGTKALGLMDMCQIDGLTPGFDVGDPRHPESTHDQGGNIDVAYYQTVANNKGRIICDASGGSNDGYYCTSVENHIVDLPRTAFFLAKLAENPRLRVVGMDKLIAPLIIAELDSQYSKGWITQAAHDAAISRAAYGDGWPFHHHHMHVSFKWWSQGLTLMKEPPIGCGFRMDGDGPL